MKTIYLIRHGKPLFPGGKHMCLGRTDIPLCEEGFMQAEKAARELDGLEFELFSSPLIRAKETAAAFKKPFKIIDDLKELYAGQWDGLSFDEIKVRYPELYAARGNDKTLPLPGAEDNDAGLNRFKNALISAAESSHGNIAVVAHAGVMGLLLKDMGSKRQKPDYGEILYISYENKNFKLIGEN